MQFIFFSLKYSLRRETNFQISGRKIGKQQLSHKGKFYFSTFQKHQTVFPLKIFLFQFNYSKRKLDNLQKLYKRRKVNPFTSFCETTNASPSSKVNSCGPFNEKNNNITLNTTNTTNNSIFDETKRKLSSVTKQNLETTIERTKHSFSKSDYPWMSRKKLIHQEAESLFPVKSFSNMFRIKIKVMEESNFVESSLARRIVKNFMKVNTQLSHLFRVKLQYYRIEIEKISLLS